jgi:hypothetical protein
VLQFHVRLGLPANKDGRPGGGGGVAHRHRTAKKISGREEGLLPFALCKKKYTAWKEKDLPISRGNLLNELRKKVFLDKVALLHSHC